MVAGRPREWDRDQVALDLLKWAKHEDHINLNQFCFQYDPPLPPSKIGLYAQEDEKFRGAYECVKAAIAWRRERKLNANELHVKAYDLNASVYDYFLREEKRAQARYESELASQHNKEPLDDKIAEQQTALMGQITKLQESFKTSRKSNSTESKS